MSDETVSGFQFDFRSCSGIESLCDVVFNGDSNSIIKRAYGWLHTCISYDFYNKSLSVAIDQELVYTEAAKPNDFFSTLDWFAFKTIRVSWESWYQYTFPEMFTLLNIYTRYRIFK